MAAAASGAALAEVTVGGDGRMGLHFDGDDWNFTSRIRIKFEASGQTDNGLSFGGSIRADNAAGGAQGASGEVFIEGAFGRITLGDVDGAAETAAGNISGVGMTGLGDYHETFYLFDQVSTQNGDPKALYSFSSGGFSFHLAAADGRGAVGGRGIPGHPPSGTPDFGDGIDIYSVGVGYEGSLAGGSFTLGLGYEHGEAQTFGLRNELIVLGGSVTFGDTTLRAMLGQVDGTFFAEGMQFGLSVDQTFGATTLTAFWRQNEYDGGGSDRWLGLGLSHDLGGGASVVAGVVHEEIRSGGASFDTTFGDLGLTFAF
jgi:outer membrane protein OmpU